ncbi:MAG: flavin reductase family protein [Microthrixaceae bacterium]
MALLRPGRLVERLTTPLDVDAYLSTIRPLWGSGTARIESVTPVGVDAASLRIRPGRGWEGHRPGQFVTLGVEVDGVRHHRSFSLTSTPDEATLEITVQATPDGLVSRHLVLDAQPGELVRLHAAAGGIDVVERDPGAPLVIITGGSGVTPAIGVLRALDAAGVDIDAVVLHHSTSPERALFTDELERLAAAHRGLRVVHVHSQPDRSHRLDVDRLRTLCADWTERHAIVSGPEPMLDAVSSIWRDAGTQERLHVERFHPATIDLRAAGAASSGGHGEHLALFATSDVVASCGGDTSLLDVAEAAGLAPPSGCRLGICHTCTTRLDRGQVRDLRDGRRHVAGEHVQLCVSRADADVVLDL